jgi:hypothetical protein
LLLPDALRRSALSLDEKSKIQSLLSLGLTATAIARQVDVNPKTVRKIAKKLHLGVVDLPNLPTLSGSQPGISLSKIRERVAEVKPVYVKSHRPSDSIKRFILTSAQNNTPIDQVVWNNLLALAEHYDARLIVGRYVYNLDALGQRGQEKEANDLAKKSAKAERWWAAEITPYVLDERFKLAPDLEWCGNMNILPTAVRPLGDLHNYTGTRSAIFPHPTIALESVPTGKHEPTKINYTTGAVTEPNYIQRKAGQKAEFHHTLGALIVEVDESGDWWARQLNADHDGIIYDLTIKVEDGLITERQPAEAINWGDIHVSQLEDWMKEACWGQNGVIDALRPRYQFMHDTLDFSSRSHHDMRNPHEMFRKFVESADSVEDELIECRDFLHYAYRQFCQTVMVDSNHDNALTKWVRDASHKSDPVNAIFYLKLELALHEAIATRQDDFHALEWALRNVGLQGDFRFLRTDESFVICDQHGNGIECGNHGHLGANGARGSDAAYVKAGRRMTIGHGHYALIWQGLYRAGVQAALDHGYNVGLSSWSQSMVITYPNGKRAICTFRNKKWRA